MPPLSAPRRCSDAPPQLPSWMSEELLRSLTNVLLELPFSRRAETEADLIGGWGVCRRLEEGHSLTGIWLQAQ